MSEESTRGSLVLLGENHGEYGKIASTTVGSRAAAAISVGADVGSPSQRFKFDRRVANEDALCVVEAGSWAAYAVADAHYGPESSHTLISRLHELWTKVRPNDLEHLGQMFDFLPQGPLPQTDSETTLLAVVYDRERRAGFGISIGDSTVAIAGPDQLPVPVNPRDMSFATARHRFSLRGAGFRFFTEPGQLLLVYTDGIDQCHYRSPATSVRPEHLGAIAEKAMYDPLTVVQESTALALTGVDGNPGGQDNVAIIAAQA